MGFAPDVKTPATDCQVASTSAHRPTPIRFVWHHIQPEGAGGATEAGNLASLCDNCHYTTHRILYALRLQYEGKPLTADQQNWIDNPPRQAQLALAKQGFAKCLAAGTVDQIPNEG